MAGLINLCEQYIASSQPRFLTQCSYLSIKGKLKREMLGVFVWDTNVARNLHLLGLENKHFSWKYFCSILQKLKDPYLFLDQIHSHCSKKVWESRPYHKGKKKYLHWSMIGEILMNSGKNSSKTRHWLTCDSFHIVNSCSVWLGADSANMENIFAIYILI